MSDLQKVSDGAGGYALLYVTDDSGKHLAKECCCEEECCLYPWPDPDGAILYPPSDAPATLIVSGLGTFTKTGSAWGQTASLYTYNDGTYDYHIDIGPSADTWWIWIDDGSDTGYADSMSPCLIGDYQLQSDLSTITVEDDFAYTYTVNGVDTITRDGAGSCVWMGPKTGGGTWMLDYNSTTPYTWHLSSDGPSPTADDKTAPQDGPPGTYGSETIA